MVNCNWNLKIMFWKFGIKVNKQNKSKYCPETYIFNKHVDTITVFQKRWLACLYFLMEHILKKKRKNMI